MSQKFKAVVIDNQNEKFTREIKEIDTSYLKDGNVVPVTFSINCSMSAKDYPKRVHILGLENTVI